ncbi:peptide-methionine (S)-S-oxide reductase MsrA [Herbaspirillum sp. RV1423]|uniref:peptide-methionine (S)-S-oxide reductase MsrA n=1 Tax=Herbaspirillum sp. RV1423 TaxID=1443993 RepID=UPI000556BAF8|nr:peptide-methionine (S)-S-oxide reductase MsrA [Herbaspirillum sp. RV1423]
MGLKKYGMPLLLSVAAWTAHVAPSLAAESAFTIPAPRSAPAAMRATAAATSETAILAGGCFWGVQAVFQHTSGVTGAVSGYAGGSKDNAHYEMVGTGSTGHAESVKITFDPRKISYGKILQIYFSVVHDPTQLNRQGPDSGTQYRSAIFYQSDEQKRIAADYIAQLDAAKVYPARIVTQLTPLPATAFYAAEDYHQDFATLHPTQGYIARFDLPKLENFKRLFPADYRAAPVTVFRY